MRIICYLRELGLPIDAIRQLLSDEDPGRVISLILDQQEIALKKEIGEREEQLQRLSELKAGPKSVPEVTVDSIGDAAAVMTSKEKLRKFHTNLVLTAIPLGVLQWTSIILWITKGIWWLFLVWVVVTIPYLIFWSRKFFQCHGVFQPTRKEGFWAKHTPTTRMLTCPHCDHHGFCVEVAAEEGVTEEASAEN